MLTTLILESANDADLDLLLHLAQRLGVKATTTPSAKASDTEQTQLVDEFAGSWQSEENGTELARQIQEGRYFRDRDVEL
jgi:hypothetical protein